MIKIFAIAVATIVVMSAVAHAQVVRETATMTPVFRGDSAIKEGLKLVQAGSVTNMANMVMLLGPLSNCIVAEGTKVVVTGDGSSLRNVNVTVAAGSNIGCRGSTPRSFLV
jgi:hypothetical protein